MWVDPGSKRREFWVWEIRAVEARGRTRARRLETARAWLTLAIRARLRGQRGTAARDLEYAGNWRRLTAEGLRGSR